MARDAEFRARIVADDEASKVIDRVAAKADDLESTDVEVQVGADTRTAERDINDVLAKVDKLAGTDAAKLVLTSNAAAITDDIAGLVLEIDRLDSTDPSIDIKVDQVRQLEDDLDKLATKAKEVSDTPIDLNTGAAKAGVDDLNVAIDKGGSVAANAYGNMAQDLGEVAGVSGTAGVALGQMGEYIADAYHQTGNLKSAFAGVVGAAGPLAAVAVGMQLIQGAMENMKADRAFNAKVVEDFSAAIRKGADAAQTLRDQMVETGKLEFSVAKTGLFQFGTETRNITEDLDRLGVSYERFIALARSGQQLEMGNRNEFDATDRAIIRINDALGDFKKNEADAAAAADAMATALGYTSVAAMNAEEGFAAFNRQLDKAPTDMPKTFDAVANAVARMEQGLEPTQNQLDAISTITSQYGATAEDVYGLVADRQDEAAEAAEELADAQQQAAQAAQDYATIVGSTDWGRAELDGATAGAERFAEAQFGLVNIASNTEAAYDGLNAAIEQNGYTFDLNTEAGRANQQAIQELYTSTIPSMAQAYADADGSISKFRTGMDSLRTGVMQQLREETSLTEDQIADVVNQMGLVPGNVSSQFEMMGVEDANAKLALLSGVIGDLPDDVQRQVTLSVLAGDPQAALDTIEASVSGAELPPATVPVEADTRPAVRTTDDFTSERRTTDPVKVDANTAAALVTIAYLNAVAKAMQPVVTVTADTFPALLAIAAAAQPRSSVINVSAPNAGNVDRQLDNIARSRNAVINVTTNQTTVLRRVDGGG